MALVAPPRPSGYLRKKAAPERTVMIVIAAAIIGATLGWRRAGQLGGTRRDRAQYAVGFAMALAVLGLFATVILDRMM
jgi:hypothetical protein